MPDAWGNLNGFKHGESSRTKRSNLHRRWGYIKQRCYNHKHPSYHNYGGRGIAMCDEWLNSFVAFADYMRKTFNIIDIPKNLEIERKDNNRGYEPGNIDLVNHIAQSNNRRTNVIIDCCGEKMTIANAARKTGVSQRTLWGRIKKGDTDLFRPVKDVRVEYLGSKITISELSRITGVPRGRLSHRIRSQGLSVMEAINPELRTSPNKDAR